MQRLVKGLQKRGNGGSGLLALLYILSVFAAGAGHTCGTYEFEHNTDCTAHGVIVCGQEHFEGDEKGDAGCVVCAYLNNSKILEINCAGRGDVVDICGHEVSLGAISSVRRIDWRCSAGYRGPPAVIS